MSDPVVEGLAGDLGTKHALDDLDITSRRLHLAEGDSTD
jgi:hypothetical protein